MSNEDNKYLKEIGKNIARIRRGKNLTQLDVCTELEMDIPYLSSIENGRQNPTLITLKKLADSIGVEIKVFFEI